MPVLRYVGDVIANLLFLGVVLGMFKVASSRFETIVVASLTLIFSAVLNTGIDLGYTLSQLAEGCADEMIRIRRLLKDSEAGEAQEELKAATKARDTSDVRTFMNALFRAAVALFALVKLLLAIL